MFFWNGLISGYSDSIHISVKLGPMSLGHSTLEHSNSGKKSFDSILATESIFSIRFDSPIW